MRGRGRGGYYDDHRRSRSPDVWARRTQPSATPPPQVPAFGSNMPVSSGPVPGVAVPTAPRSQRLFGHSHGSGGTQTSIKLVNKNSKQEVVETPSLPTSNSSPPVMQPDPSAVDNEVQQPTELFPAKVPATDAINEEEVRATDATNAEEPTRKRKLISGKRQPKPIVRDDSDAEDSADDLDDNYFVEEIAKINENIAQAPGDPAADSPGAEPEEAVVHADAAEKLVSNITKLTSPDLCEPEESTKEAPISESEPPISTIAAESSSTAIAPPPASNDRISTLR